MTRKRAVLALAALAVAAALSVPTTAHAGVPGWSPCLSLGGATVHDPWCLAPEADPT
jgi:hypothetical protein